MATEVGTAYVAIIPSAKGFARNLQKSIAKEFVGSKLDTLIADALAGTTVSMPVRPEVKPGDLPDELPVRPGREPKLPVKLDPLTKALQDDVRRELAALTKEVSAQVEVNADTDGLRTEIATAISQVETSLAADIPTEPAERREYERKLRAQVEEVTRSVRARIETDVRVDAESSIRNGSVDQAGESVGQSLARRVMSSFSGGLSSIPAPVLFAPLIAGAVAVAPLAGAAIAAGVLAALGGGVIGLAFLSLAKDPLMQRAASGLAGAIQSTLAKAAGPLLGTEDKPGPILLAMETLTDLVMELAPSLEQMFASIGPYIPTLAAGVADFVRAVMPGLLAAVAASGPILEALAFNMGPLGETISELLMVMVELAPAAVAALNVLLDITRLLITTFSGLVYVLGAAFGGIYGWYEDFREETSQLLAFVGYLFTHAGQVIVAVLRGIVQIGVRLWRDLTNGLRSATSGGLGGVVSLFLGLPRRILGALGNPHTLLINAGRNIIQGLINGVRQMIDPLQGLLGSITNMIPNWKGPLDKDRRLLEPAGVAIMGGLIRGIDGQVPALRSQLGTVTDLIAGAPLAVAPATPYGLAASATPSPAGLRVEWVGGDGDPLVRAFRENIRIYYGGSPHAALGSA